MSEEIPEEPSETESESSSEGEEDWHEEDWHEEEWPEEEQEPTPELSNLDKIWAGQLILEKPPTPEPSKPSTVSEPSTPSAPPEPARPAPLAGTAEAHLGRDGRLLRALGAAHDAVIPDMEPVPDVEGDHTAALWQQESSPRGESSSEDRGRVARRKLVVGTSPAASSSKPPPRPRRPPQRRDSSSSGLNPPRQKNKSRRSPGQRGVVTTPRGYSTGAAYREGDHNVESGESELLWRNRMLDAKSSGKRFVEHYRPQEPESAYASVFRGILRKT